MLDLLVEVRTRRVRVGACDACGTLGYPRRMDPELRARLEALAGPVAKAILEERQRAVGFVAGLVRWDMTFDGSVKGPRIEKLRAIFAEYRASPWGQQGPTRGISREEMLRRYVACRGEVT